MKRPIKAKEPVLLFVILLFGGCVSKMPFEYKACVTDCAYRQEWYIPKCLEYCDEAEKSLINHGIRMNSNSIK